MDKDSQYAIYSKPCSPALQSGCRLWRQAEDISFERDASGELKEIGSGAYGKVCAIFGFAEHVCNIAHDLFHR